MQLTPAQKSFLTWSAIISTLVFVLGVLRPVLAPFVIASVIAYALTPLVNWLDNAGRGRVPRVLAVIVVETLFVVALTGMLLLLVPIIAKELPLMREQVPILLDAADAALRPWLAQYGVQMAFDLGSLKTIARTYFDSNFEETLGSVLTSVKLGGSVAFAVVSNAVLIPIALFYLLMEWDALVAQLFNLVPPRLHPSTESFVRDADAVLGQYLRGQLLVMLVLAVFYSAGLALFGLDLAIPIGVFTGLAVFVPYLGYGTGLVLAAFAGILEFSAAGGVLHTVTMLAVVYGSGQILEGFYLTPKLVGKRIGLHPLAVIFALLAFGQVLGFVGVLIALPLSAVLLVAFRRLRSTYIASRLYVG
jgi:predicted PurR-regulated permease PerM